MAHADSPTKTCGEDGCCRPLRARGLCSTHYNKQHQPERHMKIEVPCGWCQRPCSKEPRRYAERFCSLSCRDTWRRRDKLPVLYVGTVVRPRRVPPPQPPRSTRRWVAGACADCGSAFVAEDYTDTARFCSRRCSRRSAKRERRAREVAASGSFTWTQVMALFVLFNHCCAYCGVQVDGQPEPDHVVPLSRQGHNTIGNILPACRMCNGDKRDLLLSEWNADRARRNLPPRIVTWSADDQRYAHLTAQRHHCTA